MSLRKRGGVWWADLTVRGRRIQRSTRTGDKRAAQEFHDRLASDLWREKQLGEHRHSWKEAVVRWLRETKHKKTHERDKARLQVLDPYFRSLALHEITRDRIDEAAADLERTRDISPAAVNRYLAVVRAILRRAEREWGWIDRAPAIRLRREPKGRVRYLSRSEYTALMRALPDYLKAPAEFTLQTGLRQSNCLRLRWEQVDMRRRVAWVEADNTKSGKSLRVPLNERAMQVLKAQQGKHHARVFVDANGHPFDGIDSKTWARALRKAEITDFRWHDLRHTWASWRVMGGTGLQELMQLGGWSTYDMVLRYAHLAPAHLDEVATNVEPPGDIPVTPVGFSRNESAGE